MLLYKSEVRGSYKSTDQITCCSREVTSLVLLHLYGKPTEKNPQNNNNNNNNNRDIKIPVFGVRVSYPYS